MGLNPILYALLLALDLLQYLILFYVVLNLLIHFDVVNRRNNFVSKLYAMFSGVVEPIFSKVRQFLPVSFGGLDLSPLIVLFAISVLKYAIVYYGAGQEVSGPALP
ncbi:MAG: YggT family protein [Rickettsiales bacterium]